MESDADWAWLSGTKTVTKYWFLINARWYPPAPGRMRRRRSALQVVKELDAFHKVEDDYQRPTTRGGTFSLISFLLIGALVVSEFFYYRSTETRYSYSVDTDMDAKMLLTVDLTIAMQCKYLGADIMDLAGESRQLNDIFTMEDASFELTELQMSFLRAKQRLQQEYNHAKSLGDLTIVEGMGELKMPSAQETSLREALERDSCRVHGSIEVKKVSGNFHVTTGRSVPHPHGHAHLNVFVPKDAVNYSHRIDHLSFGPAIPGMLNPLDAVYKVAEERPHQFQYFMQVVPTKFRTLDKTLTTSQYSVRERNRTIDHRKGSHGMGGIFFKYDMSPMMVAVVEERRPFGQFLVRLSGIVGGVFATSGMISAIIGSMTEGVLSCLFWGRKDHSSSSSSSSLNTKGSSGN